MVNTSARHSCRSGSCVEPGVNFNEQAPSTDKVAEMNQTSDNMIPMLRAAKFDLEHRETKLFDGFFSS